MKTAINLKRIKKENNFMEMSKKRKYKYNVFSLFA